MSSGQAANLASLRRDGLDEFVDEVHAEARDPHAIPEGALFPAAFMDAHTGHADLASYLAAGGDPAGADLDAYVARTTAFPSFEELRAAAARAYVARRVLDWIL